MKVMIAGAGGILGRKLVSRYLERNDTVVALVLRAAEMKGMEHPRLQIVAADVTRPETLHNTCTGCEVVVSCVGITRIRGRLTHEDVDYRGNLNLLNEAERAGVRKFGFITPAGTAEGHREAPLLSAKHRFKQALRASTISWVIFRSGGFFSDLGAMKKLAAKGPLFVIGDGSARSTPIDVDDLAGLMVDELQKQSNAVVELGGPEHLSWLDICRLCFEVQQKPVRLMRVPVWLCRAALALLRPFSFKHFAMGRLLLFMSTHDVCTPTRGTLTLRRYLDQMT